MINHSLTRNVGTADPDLTTSPIADESDEELLLLDQDIPTETVCYFNNIEYPSGSYVKNGPRVLKCYLGTWVPAGHSIFQESINISNSGSKQDF